MMSLAARRLGRETRSGMVSMQKGLISSLSLMPESSPNPKALRFVPSDGRLRLLKPGYTSAVEIARSRGLSIDNEALTSPSMVEKAFENEHAAIVLVAPSFISVTTDDFIESDEIEWDAVQQALENGLERDLGDGKWKAIFGDDASDVDETKNGAPVARETLEEQIEHILDEMVRPNLQSDGGDVEFRGLENGVVKLRLIGACQSCPSSTVTLRFGVKNLLTRMFEEVEDVVQVYDRGDLVSRKGEGWTG
eukprot:CAMPEP_0184553378 /NCGR_PEP_ID=MMETSP0199_2-20130426/31883_1 /TAXON_ID=1112570 /ORGANISM="Thraustochytrium sp., Strain LLF1b" /LENGTH=249 /DNA_ID=CAMNT_0026949129 /DNA_START=159 /DNA_END=908 /DNA_ORIENTATION=+